MLQPIPEIRVHPIFGALVRDQLPLKHARIEVFKKRLNRETRRCRRLSEDGMNRSRDTQLVRLFLVWKFLQDIWPETSLDEVLSGPAQEIVAIV